eukprot:CAMPEP_0182928368 /NCGR_PEP_ID=MMETSP0105_2-20130417/15549_1 /TAXON_ID=81532 ORGANISM="Acanthoeca-like sp., Strain 10tr" /NCGR_SAMPLE_ID=MMETSP0105_2 /ASSEMBLY_ACC=CAM_ASM_000205 /LENGTH=754 /DNA_ID=CAMNT_0025066369 /DNA_START=110 /DNA_END=2374 /DNA_ORIENTATION=+
MQVERVADLVSDPATAAARTLGGFTRAACGVPAAKPSIPPRRAGGSTTKSSSGRSQHPRQAPPSSAARAKAAQSVTAQSAAAAARPGRKAKLGTNGRPDGAADGPARPAQQSKRRRVAKVADVPAGFRLFKISVNGFKQCCHVLAKEEATLADFRKQILEGQQAHPRAIPEGAWDRVVLLRARPTTMKTTCIVPDDLVIPDDATQRVASLTTIPCVHMYLLCPGPPLPKEFPGKHRRLAKRDTKVCEAHSKQERRAVRRTDPRPTPAAQSAVPEGLPEPVGAPEIGAVLAGPVIAAAVASGEQDIKPLASVPATIPVQLTPGEPPVLCSVETAAFEHVEEDDSREPGPKRLVCSVPECKHSAVEYHIGNTMVLPEGTGWQFCQECVNEFNEMPMSQRVMDVLASCNEQVVHERHFTYRTTPKMGPLRFGRLASIDRKCGRVSYFCSCVDRACTMGFAADNASMRRFLTFLSLGLRPNWKPAAAPKIACRGARSLHIQFEARANRSQVQVEVINTDHVEPGLHLFARFGEHFDDRVHLVPGNPQTVTDYMIEGLDPEKRYGIRLVEVIAGSARKRLGDAMTRLCLRTGVHTIGRTRPEVPTQGPFARLQQVDDDEAEGPLAHLASAAASQSPALITMASSKNGRHSWAVPVRVDDESKQSAEPRVAITEPEGEEFTVFPQPTPALAFQEIISNADENDEDGAGVAAGAKGSPAHATAAGCATASPGTTPAGPSRAVGVTDAASGPPGASSVSPKP